MSTSSNLIELEVPARAEFVRIVRLVLAGVGNVARFNLEEIEDLKLAAGESCYTTFHGVRSPDARVKISARALQDAVEVTVSRQHQADEMPDLFQTPDGDKGVGFILLKHLVDEVSLHTGSRETKICMLKRRQIPKDEQAAAVGAGAEEPTVGA